MKEDKLLALFKFNAFCIFVLGMTMLFYQYCNAFNAGAVPVLAVIGNNVYPSQRLVKYGLCLPGILSLIVVIQGLLVAKLMCQNASKAFTELAFRLWITQGIILTVLLLIQVLYLNAIVRAMIREILNIMKTGISLYLTSKEWKISIDLLQKEFKCCGIDSINDWYVTKWIPIRSLKPEIVASREILSDNGSLGHRVVPFSCCDPNSKMPCLHDLFQRKFPEDDNTASRSIFTNGCGEPLADEILKIVIAHQILASLLVILNICQIILGKSMLSIVYQSERGIPTDTNIEPVRAINRSEERMKIPNQRIISPFQLGVQAATIQTIPYEELDNRLELNNTPTKTEELHDSSPESDYPSSVNTVRTNRSHGNNRQMLKHRRPKFRKIRKNVFSYQLDLLSTPANLLLTSRKEDSTRRRRQI